MTLKRWEQGGDLPYYRMGGRIRYKLSDIIAIEKSSQGTTPAMQETTNTTH